MACSQTNHKSLIGRVFNLNLSAEVVADLERLAAETVR
jgi:hypothetical protein